jgi:predicted nuclease with RNAse H fold
VGSARPRSALWAGVDVGGRRKKFDVAVVDSRRVVGVRSSFGADEVAHWLRGKGPDVIAIDSPRSAAPKGTRSREGERALASSGLCGIRFTPDLATLQTPHPTNYYEWILAGLELYRELSQGSPKWSVIEVFPTASWSTWAGSRPKHLSRARWSNDALTGLGVGDVPDRTNQDVRDAIAAALTARLYPDGTRPFGEIVVPTRLP